MAAAKTDGPWETVKTVFWALVIAGVFRTLFFQPFWIPSGSMKDTLLIGDFLFVNKMAYGYSRHSCPFSACPVSGRIFGSEPERGDVVVFRHPVTNADFIKRVMGLPGDTIQVQNGQVILNGAPLPLEPEEPFVETFAPQGPEQILPGCANGTVGQGGDCIKQRFTEVLPNGVSHSVLNILDNNPRRFTDNTNVYTVPDGMYFFMGDNRDNSS
ncbi:MAG: signal peptidase I, partial [Pseudomonadota bacterium]